MVVFEKNGQGFFDFDFKVLEGITSNEFATQVRWALDSKYIQQVEVFDSKDFYSVYVLSSSVIKEILYSKHDGQTILGMVSLNVVRYLNLEGVK